MFLITDLCCREFDDVFLFHLIIILYYAVTIQLPKTSPPSTSFAHTTAIAVSGDPEDSDYVDININPVAPSPVPALVAFISPDQRKR